MEVCKLFQFLSCMRTHVVDSSQGCDASILLDSDYSQGITSEMMSSKNFGIRGRESISKIKSMVEAFCPGVVSCADILALAAREAVAYAGGPHIMIPLGRLDSLASSNLRADAELPSPSVGVDGAMRMFMAMGMSVGETVAILGKNIFGYFLYLFLLQILNTSLDLAIIVRQPSTLIEHFLNLI